MAIEILEDITQYKIVSSFSEDYQRDTKNIDNIDCLFNYAVVKTDEYGNLKYLFPKSSLRSISFRVVVYALMDFREMTGSNKIPLCKFVDWLKYKYNYKGYYKLVWITFCLAYKKSSDYFNLKELSDLEHKENFKSNLNEDLEDIDFEKFNISKLKKSKLIYKNLNYYNLVNSISILHQSKFISLNDESVSLNKKKYDLTTRTNEIIILRKSFFKIEKRFKEQNLLF